MRAPLIFRVYKGNQLVEVKQFDLEQIVIGRNAEVQLDLDHESVSPIHCLIELRDNGYYVCDLGSQSGTILNGQTVLDEAVTSGDEIKIGPFTINFFVGVPKPKTATPTPEKKVVVVQEKADTPIITPSLVSEVAPMVVRNQEVKMSEPVVTKPQTEDQPQKIISIENEKPVGKIEPKVSVPSEKPNIQRAPKKTQDLQKLSKKTFAPPSEIKDLKSYLKPGKGNVVEVLVCWKERVLETYHFRKKGAVKVGTDIQLPDGSLTNGFKLLQLGSSVGVSLSQQMKVESVSSSGSLNLEALTKAGKIQGSGQGVSLRLDQNEVVYISFENSPIQIVVRFVPAPPVMPLIPPLFFTGSEVAGVVISLIIVMLLSLYIEANKPRLDEGAKQDDLTRTASIIFSPTPTPMPTPTPVPTPEPTPVPTPEPTPLPVVKATPAPTPTPEPQKIKVADEKKEAKKKGDDPSKKSGVPNQVAKKAAEVAPIPNSENKPKKFTSALKQGGAVKIGEKEGAGAQSGKDVTKMGLFSAFGGGGIRGKLDQAYSGAGDLLGQADKATGSSGMGENRAGDDLGSKFKEVGAGGKGISTQGIAGIGTKGRSSGQSAYGSENGFGNKTSVAIEAGGAEEDFVGTIDKEAVRRVVKAGYREIKGCYERELNKLGKKDKFEGKIVIGWDIVAKGKAQNVHVKSTTLNNKSVENCLRERIAGWIFPEPPSGLTAEVAFPFVFRAQDN